MSFEQGNSYIQSFIVRSSKQTPSFQHPFLVPEPEKFHFSNVRQTKIKNYKKKIKIYLFINFLKKKFCSFHSGLRKRLTISHFPSPKLWAFHPSMAFSLFNSKPLPSIILVLLLASLCHTSHGVSPYDGSTRRLFGPKRLTVPPSCGELVLESQCSQNSKCSWCTSKDLDDMCFTKSEALRLPHQVFSCGLIRWDPFSFCSSF